MDGFYNIVMNLQQYLFKVFIYPPDGRPAGMAKDLDVVPGPRFRVDYILFDGAILNTSGTCHVVHEGVKYANLRLNGTPDRQGAAVFKVR